MSIATELTNLNNNILDAYTAVQGKGGTVPANKNMVNLPTAISSISGGGGTGIPREVDTNGVYVRPTQPFTFSLPPDATDVGNYALYSAFYYNDNNLTSVDLSSLTTVSGRNALDNAFRYCLGITSVDLSSLTTVSGAYAFNYAFCECRGITSVVFPALTTLSYSNVFQYIFSSCSSLASVSFPALATVSGNSAFYYAFTDCTSLTSVSFPALTTVSGSSAFSYTFNSCTNLTSLYFPALTTTSFGTRTNQFSNMLKNCSGVTVHFPAAIQSTIGSWASVTGGFGGTNTTVLFDL